MDLTCGTAIMSRIRWGFIWYRKTVRISCPSIISRIRWGFIWNLKTARISRYWKVYHEHWAGSGEDSFEIGKLSEFLATGRSIMSRIRWGFIWNLKTVSISCSKQVEHRWWAGSGEDSFEIWKLPEFLALKRWNIDDEQDQVRIHLI